MHCFEQETWHISSFYATYTKDQQYDLAFLQEHEHSLSHNTYMYFRTGNPYPTPSHTCSTCRDERTYPRKTACTLPQRKSTVSTPFVKTTSEKFYYQT